MHHEEYKLASQSPLQKKEQRQERHVRPKSICSQRAKRKHFCDNPEIEIEIEQ